MPQTVQRTLQQWGHSSRHHNILKPLAKGTPSKTKGPRHCSQSVLYYCDATRTYMYLLSRPSPLSLTWDSLSEDESTTGLQDDDPCSLSDNTIVSGEH